jgi:hypothetical protein
MNTKNALYGALCGALVFAVLSWAAPRKAVSAAVLTSPPEGRYELVQLHPSSGTEWSGILDTETGCTWAYVSQTPPTDAEISAAPAGTQRAQKIYLRTLGGNYFGSLGYNFTGSGLILPGEQKPSNIGESEIATLNTEQFYCAQARQNALQAAATR